MKREVADNDCCRPSAKPRIDSGAPVHFKREWQRPSRWGRARNHNLRHAFGTALYEQTGDIYAVQNAMGHADVKTSMRYVHRRQSNDRRDSSSTFRKFFLAKSSRRRQVFLDRSFL
jgi:integrase